MRLLTLILCLFVFSCDSDSSPAAPSPILGCMDNTACNYDGTATQDDDSCEYSQEYINCDNVCIDINNDGYADSNGYSCSDIYVLQDFIDINPILDGQHPLEILRPYSGFNSGRLTKLVLTFHELISIPESISDLDALEHLALGNNQLESIPNAIGDLINLVNLQLDENNLTTIPESILNLVNLTTLNLTDNQLISLPMGLCDLNIEWDASVPSYTFSGNNLCEEYHYDCIGDQEWWGSYGDEPQDQSNCCEGGPDGQPNWTACP